MISYYLLTYFLLLTMGFVSFSFSYLLMWKGWIGLNYSSSFFVFFEYYTFPLIILQLDSLSSGMLHFLLIHGKMLLILFVTSSLPYVFLSSCLSEFPQFSFLIYHLLNSTVVRICTWYGFLLKCIKAFHFSDAPL